MTKLLPIKKYRKKTKRFRKKKCKKFRKSNKRKDKIRKNDFFNSLWGDGWMLKEHGAQNPTQLQSEQTGVRGPLDRSHNTYGLPIYIY
jgi:hypothetical protein